MTKWWEKKLTVSNPDKLWAYIIGVGLAIYPIHNQALTELVTKDGEVGFFLPAFGVALWLMGSLAFILWNWKRVTWGPKPVYISLFVIAVAIAISGINAQGLTNKISPLFMAGTLVCLYLCARILGRELIKPIIIGVALAIIGVFISSAIDPGKLTGGLLFDYNYDIVIGYVMLGVVAWLALYEWKHSWLVFAAAMFAVFLTGSPEGVFALGVLILAIIIRRHAHRKFWYSMGILVVLIAIMTGLGITQKLYSYAFDIISDPAGEQTSSLNPVTGRSAIGYRIQTAKQELGDLQPLGDGYSITDFTGNPVHNVPLIIVQQLGYHGIIAGTAWLFVCVYLLMRSHHKYIWLMVLALSVADHFMWTQIGAWWWMLAGLSNEKV